MAFSCFLLHKTHHETPVQQGLIANLPDCTTALGWRPRAFADYLQHYKATHGNLGAFISGMAGISIRANLKVWSVKPVYKSLFLFIVVDLWSAETKWCALSYLLPHGHGSFLSCGMIKALKLASNYLCDVT